MEDFENQSSIAKVEPEVLEGHRVDGAGRRQEVSGATDPDAFRDAEAGFDLDERRDIAVDPGGGHARPEISADLAFLLGRRRRGQRQEKEEDREEPHAQPRLLATVDRATVATAYEVRRIDPVLASPLQERYVFTQQSTRPPSP